MKNKGRVVDYVLLIIMGICLLWCLYDALVGSDPLLLLVVFVTSVIYIVSLPKRHREIQSYEQTPKETDPVDVVERIQRIEEKYVQAEIDRLTGRAEG